MHFLKQIPTFLKQRVDLSWYIYCECIYSEALTRLVLTQSRPHLNIPIEGIRFKLLSGKCIKSFVGNEMENIFLLFRMTWGGGLWKWCCFYPSSSCLVSLISSYCLVSFFSPAPAWWVFPPAWWVLSPPSAWWALTQLLWNCESFDHPPATL